MVYLYNFALLKNYNMTGKNIRLLIFLIIAVFVISIGGCKKDKKIDDPIIENNDSVNIASEIDQFIWYNMNLYYLWYKNVPNLADNRFATTSALLAFLKTYSSHDDLFESLLYQPGTIDKWSWIVDDYVALENSFQGVSLSMGFEYGLVRYGNEGVFGYVQYVVPGTPAAIAGIKRGDIFIAIDSQNLNMSNYRTLLFDRNAFAISFANIINNVITPNNHTVSLTAVEVHENPIHYTKLIESSGRKVGYMVYNAFRSNYDNDLNTAFGVFKNAGIQDLILDFRYNGGGSVQTAAYLASMIYRADSTKVFALTQYNDKLDDYFRGKYGSDYFKTRFEAGIAQESGPDKPINSLNLNRVYIITTGGSASASELVINGLDPYMEVILVGENTHGKNVGSFTIKDYDNNGNINPNHKWALQPITLKIANSNGVSDFVNGFSPDIEAEEDIANLLPFGDVNEPMLKAALNAINGVPQTKSYSPSIFKKVADSKSFKPHSKEMYFEGDILPPNILKKK